jgi:hypothetical protein
LNPTHLTPLCRATAQLGAVAALLLIGVACSAHSVDHAVISKPIRVALTSSDLRAGCTSAEANLSMIASVTKKPARRALTILEMTAAVCPELDAWETELQIASARRTAATNNDLARLTDLRLTRERQLTLAGTRDWRAFQHAVAEFGEIGGECPKLGRDDEFAYLMGLFAASSALLYDQAGGNQIGVPTSTLTHMATAATCLDDAKWWGLPSALQAGSWIMVPGLAPAGVDPWQALEDAATRGDATTIRAARAVQIVLAANTDNREVLRHAIERIAAGDEVAERDPDYVFLDTYARRVALHQSDLIWMNEQGHRTSKLGTFPEPEGTTGDEGSPFDPFAE